MARYRDAIQWMVNYGPRPLYDEERMDYDPTIALIASVWGKEEDKVHNDIADRIEIDRARSRRGWAAEYDEDTSAPPEETPDDRP